MHIKLKATPGIYLVGFMGCGKSTVGGMLAARLGWDFIDLDHEIETRQGSTIADIFERRGEGAFRDMEHSALREQANLVCQGRPRVLSLGGGAFASERNREALVNAGVSLWLDSPAEVLWARVSGETQRPLARDRAAFEKLLAERLPAYRLADFRVPADGSPGEVVESILRLGLL
jgi:shikimate kinase